MGGARLAAGWCARRWRGRPCNPRLNCDFRFNGGCRQYAGHRGAQEGDEAILGTPADRRPNVSAAPTQTGDGRMIIRFCQKSSFHLPLRRARARRGGPWVKSVRRAASPALSPDSIGGEGEFICRLCEISVHSWLNLFAASAVLSRNFVTFCEDFIMRKPGTQESSENHRNEFLVSWFPY